MRTAFDHITDDEIEAAGPSLRYDNIPADQHARRILCLAVSMRHWNHWIGHPVTYFTHDDNFDGNHRVRAAKFNARRYNHQISIPVRYDPKMP